MKCLQGGTESLKDVGYSEEELAAAWHGVPFSMRDHRAQLLIWKAAQYDMAKADAQAMPDHRQLPAVQRPGIAPSPGERSAVDSANLRNEFKKASGQRTAEARSQITPGPTQGEEINQMAEHQIIQIIKRLREDRGLRRRTYADDEMFQTRGAAVCASALQTPRSDACAISTNKCLILGTTTGILSDNISCGKRPSCAPGADLQKLRMSD